MTTRATPFQTWRVREATLHEATRLTDQGLRAEAQPVIATTTGGPVVTAHAMIAAASAMFGLWWPFWGVTGLLLVGASAVSDLNGGRGWVRGLVLRSISRTLVTWILAPASPRGRRPHRCARGPVNLVHTSPSRPGGAGPLPSPAGLSLLPAQASSPVDLKRPLYLICLPMEPQRVRHVGVLLWLPMSAWAFSLLGILTAWVAPDSGHAMITWGAGALVTLALLQATIHRLRPPRPEGTEGLSLARRLLDTLDAPQDRDVAVVVLGGGTLFNDGIELLLRNHADRLDPALTSVLVWHPAPGALRLLTREGRVTPRSADDHLLRVAGSLGLPTGTGTTAAARARRLGWAAVALAGGDPDEGARTLLTLARRA